MSDETRKQEAEIKEKAGQAEVKAEAKTASARKGGSGKTSAVQPVPREEAQGQRQASGPWVYVGPNDPRKQLKKKTAYLQIPEGLDEALFVELDAYPAWVKQQKEAGK